MFSGPGETIEKSPDQIGEPFVRDEKGVMAAIGLDFAETDILAGPFQVCTSSLD